MKIEFWVDYNHPLCYKQQKIIASIIRQYQFDDFELLYRNYEMIPNYEPSNNESFLDILSKHHGSSKEEIKLLYPDLPNDIKPVKVEDAHRLSHLAKKYHLSFEYHQAVFKAYYVQKKDISSHEVLRSIGLEIGLNLDEINEVLHSDLYQLQIESNRENANLKGIFELPHLRIDGKIKLSGYQDRQKLLTHLLKQSNYIPKQEHCEGENCERKKTR